jgi:GcrA cell cycle regulator
MTHRGCPIGNTKAQKWELGHDAALRNWFNRGYSFSQAATKINDEFDTRYSRNACIGRAGRIGLVSALTKTRQPVISKKPDRQHERWTGGAPRQRARVPSPPPVCTETPARHVTLADLEPGDCRFPFGEGPFTFCGAPKLGGSYCGFHAKICCGAGTISERMAAR